MSAQPFGQPPAFGSVPAAPAAPPVAVPDEPARGGRTVVIAVAAGVVALGVLGGAAVLVLSGDEPAATDQALAPAPAVVEPSTPATAEVSTPLPTAAVLGRNIFVPLVAPPAAEGSGEAVPVAVPTSSPVASTPGTTGAGGLPGATSGRCRSCPSRLRPSP